MIDCSYGSRHRARADRSGLGQGAGRPADHAADRDAFPSGPRRRLRLDRREMGPAPAHVAYRMADRQPRGDEPATPITCNRAAYSIAATASTRRALQRFLDGVVLYSDGVTLPNEPQAAARRRSRRHRPGPLARHHRRRPFAGACVALLRRAENPDRRRPDPAEHHHQRQHLACRAGVRRGRRVPQDLQDVPRRAASRHADPAVAPQAVPQRAAPAARSSPCITPSAST